MSQPLNLVLLYGGKSGEHEISLMSAASVLQQLDPNKYHVIPIGMDKEGCFYLNDYQELLSFKDSLPVKATRSKRLPSLVENGRLITEADLVFPVVHGPLYEDGALQGLLELSNVPYVGCDVLSSAIGMDKDIMRRLACNDKIISTRYRILYWHADTAQREQFCQEVVKEFGWPLFIKPNAMGSSVGIHKATTLSELTTAIEDAFHYDDTILVEEGVKGREIELAVLENKNPALRPLVSLAGEICVHHPDGFYSYAAKYLESEACTLEAPAKLSDSLLAQLQDLAADIFTRLKCQGMARVDFFVDEEGGRIYFNEINTLPGFTQISMYPKLWQVSGMDYPSLLDNLINRALDRWHIKKQLITSYK